MEQQQQTRRRNGFQKPLNMLQIGTWILFPILIIHYFAFLYPLLWPYLSVRIVVTFVFLASSIAALITGYLVCSIDPADDHILIEQTTVEANPVYCYLCETNVDCTSKHCRFCDKCIVGFDHHCKWLNTCVGSKNYRHFLSAIAAITLKTTLQLLLSTYFLVEAYAYPSSFNKRLTDVNAEYNTFPTHQSALYLPLEGVRGVLIGSVAILVPLVSLIYQLAGFHSMLVCRGLTTYDFIVLEQKRQREKTAGGAGNHNTQSNHMDDSDSGEDCIDENRRREEEGTLHENNEECEGEGDIERESGRESDKQQKVSGNGDNNENENERKQEQYQIQHQERKELQQRLLLKQYQQQQQNNIQGQPTDLENNANGTYIHQNMNGTYVRYSKEEQESEDSIIELYTSQQQQERERERGGIANGNISDSSDRKLPVVQAVPHQASQHQAPGGKGVHYDPIPKLGPRYHDRTANQGETSGPIEFYAEQYSSDDHSADLNPSEHSRITKKGKNNSTGGAEPVSVNDMNESTIVREGVGYAAISSQNGQVQEQRDGWHVWAGRGKNEGGETRTTDTSPQPPLLTSPTFESQLREKEREREKGLERERERQREKNARQSQQNAPGTLAYSKSETAVNSKMNK